MARGSVSTEWLVSQAFATGDGGGDLVSLAAFVSGLPQREAAIRLAESMGVSPWA